MNSKCKCGCGGTPNTGKMFISGHNKGNKKPLIEFTCLHCGKLKEVIPSLSIRKFCSNQCRDDFRKARASPDHPQYKRIEMKCEICGTNFIIAPGRVKNIKRYCSIECGNEARAIRLRSKTQNYGRTINHKSHLRWLISQRDKEKCKICDFNIVTEVHHIVPVSKGGLHSLENIITLCPNHHAMVHKLLISPEELFTYLSNNKLDIINVE